jgi:hypothetical protein
VPLGLGAAKALVAALKVAAGAAAAVLRARGRDGRLLVQARLGVCLCARL